jgi:hypothetical protein
LFAFALIVAGCAEPAPNAASSSTRAVDPVDETTTTTTVAATTSTTTLATTTSLAAPSTTSSVDQVVDGQPPVVELKPPGFYEVLPLEEVPEYFIFGMDISPSHTTKYTAANPDETWSMTARTDGELVHYVGTGSLAGEMMVSGADVWVRDGAGEWVIDEEMFELPFFVAVPSPDVAYGMAYKAFDTLLFAGWVDVGGQRLAVYRGGAEAAASALESDEPLEEGSMEAWWSPVGYFPMVEIEQVWSDQSSIMNWTITEVGTTEVERPD